MARRAFEVLINNDLSVVQSNFSDGLHASTSKIASDPDHGYPSAAFRSSKACSVSLAAEASRW